MELELKHIVGYLPYGLKIENSYGDIVQADSIEDNGFKYYRGNKRELSHINESKPILRPLSDLTKEIYVDGEKFVPLEVIGKTFEPNGVFEDCVFGWNTPTGGDDYQDYYYVVKNDLTFEISCGDPGDSYSYVINEGNLHNDIIEKLYEWHFDIHGLIEKNLAIDINTLNQ